MHATFPTQTENWPKFSRLSTAQACGDRYDACLDELRAYAAGNVWIPPARTTFFLCDQHADPAAFFRSLVASGGIAKTGPYDFDFELTDAGHAGQFVIGGDCFDKGPTNLGLLRALKALIDIGAHVEILAGNHDVRALVGLEYLGRKEPHLAHLFVRMGKKSVPLFREIYDLGVDASVVRESEDDLARLLYPSDQWFREFPRAVSGRFSERGIALELARIREKIAEFEAERRRQRMTLAMLYAAALAARTLFLEPEGEFHWFFERMKLVKRSGSVLFVHAGVDDRIASMLRLEGVDALNQEFRRLLTSDLFTLYHGPVGNMFRTKYREHELPLTRSGVRDLHLAGIRAVVHGHRNIPRGQRVLLRNGLLNFECDTTVDANTRKLLGLEGPGGGVTIFSPKGTVLGISTDYPFVKRFDATRLFQMRIDSRRDPLGRSRHRKGAMTMSDKSEVTFESQMTVDEAISYFEAIISSLKRGSVTITQAGKTLTLEPAQTMKVEVEAERKKSKEEIAIKMKWKTKVPELQISGSTAA